MLTTADREEIKRLVAEVLSNHAQGVESADALQNIVALIRDLILNEGFTEISFTNQTTGERRVLNVFPTSDSLVDITARAIEIFGTRDKAMRWLRTPVRVLGNRTPMSFLNDPDGIRRVQDALGQIEHGIW